MGDGKSLIELNVDLGKFAKPADRLIKVISQGFGKVYEPTHLRRMAKAKVDSKKTLKLGELALQNELEERAIIRVVSEETRNQKNIEDITREAISHLNEDATPEKMDLDWVVHFLEQSKIVSDEQMQILWGKILAGEANKEGSFSKRTVSFLSSLEKEEADVFTQLCGFCITGPNVTHYPVIIRYDEKIYNKVGIDHRSLSHLDSIGLINFNTVPPFVISNVKSGLVFHYFEQTFNIELPNEQNAFPIGQVLFTQIGNELCKISGATPVKGFLSFLKEDYSKRKIKIKF
ncbi:MAG: DUF2806 domain-containing protein [Proteobacteria bacterium]|nr:DUF2806 domain-containing protein [Pseudomonadota bacterium]